MNGFVIRLSMYVDIVISTVKLQSRLVIIKLVQKNNYIFVLFYHTYPTYEFVVRVNL